MEKVDFIKDPLPGKIEVMDDCDDFHVGVGLKTSVSITLKKTFEDSDLFIVDDYYDSMKVTGVDFEETPNEYHVDIEVKATDSTRYDLIRVVTGYKKESGEITGLCWKDLRFDTRHVTELI